MSLIEFAIPQGSSNVDRGLTFTPDRYNVERSRHPLKFLDYFTIINPIFGRKEAFDGVSVVILGGASGVGKTTFFTEARERTLHNPAFDNSLVFPVRQADRPPRDTDRVYNETVFEPQVLDTETSYAVRWTRHMNQDTTYTYGFREIGDHNVAALSGNNALLEQLAAHDELLFDSQGNRRIVRVGIYADEETRARRLQARSGHEIPSAEMAKRLSDPTATAKDPRFVDLTIDNSEDHSSDGYTPSRNFTTFLWRLVSRRDDAVESKAYLYRT